MNVETVAIQDLTPDPENARTHDSKNLKAIAGSLEQFGQRKPIVITSNGVIIAGNGTVRAAKELGWTHIDATRLPEDWTADKAKAYALADNRTAELADWDPKILADQLIDLDGMGWDVSSFGFDELNPLIDPSEEDDTPLTFNEDEPAITQPGDIYQLGRHRLMCGDSTEVTAVEKLMGDNKADMIFTDPPYGVDYKGIYNDDKAGLENLLREVFGNYVIASKPGSSIYVFHSDRNADIFHKVFREFFHFSSMIIWAKNSLTLSQTDYQSQHEPCLYGWLNNGSHSFYGDRKQISIWSVDKERVEGHTTPKPVVLVAKAIANSSKSGDLIIDLFGGSGSTLIACEQTNRTCYMMELDPKYCDVIVKRWETLTGLKATLLATPDTN
jgi:site-specific DNA-methyltransferase (adenine-specific)